MGTNAYGESLTAWVMGFHPSLAIFFCISILVFRIFWVRGGPDLVYIMHFSFLVTLKYFQHSLKQFPPDSVIFLQKQLKEGEYGTDMQTVKVEYDRHQKEHKVIDQFQGNVEKCREAEVKFHGEELKIYGERMTILQKAYNELLVLSNKRVSDLHSLHDFMHAAHAELTWLNEREDRECGRDWADKNLKLTEVESYYEVSA